MNTDKHDSGKFDLTGHVILIIDDTPENLTIITEYLEECGGIVFIAEDGKSGLTIAESARPDLILLDIMMPGIDGYETCRRLKGMAATRDIPVIFMTGLVETESKIRGFAAGAVDHVSKPLQRQEVAARISVHLRLRELTARLEEKVDKRTKELLFTNQRLQQEIAKRKRIDWELLVLNGAINNSTDAFFLIDDQHLFRYINDAACHSLGYSREELLAMGLLDINPDISPDTLEGLKLIASESGLLRPIETRHRAQDGHIFPVEVSATPFEYDGVTFYLTMVRDISERKVINRELLLLSEALNNTGDAVSLINEQFRFVYVNDQACRDLGYSSEELLTMGPLDIDPDVSLDMLKEMQNTLSEIRFLKPFEARPQAKDGRIFPVEISSSLFEHEGVKLFISVARDISERKRSAQQLELLNHALALCARGGLSDRSSRQIPLCQSAGLPKPGL